MRNIQPFPSVKEINLDLNVPGRDYKPYHPDLNDHWLHELLEQLRVSVTQIVRWDASPRWAMEERRMPDDVLWYVVKGRGKLRIEQPGRSAAAGRVFELAAGDCAHVRRGVRHAATTDPRHPMQHIVLRYTATVFDSLTLPEVFDFPDVMNARGDRKLRELLVDACREFAWQPAGYGPGLEASMTRILLHLLREHCQAFDLRSCQVKLTDLRRLLPALKAMKEKLADPIWIPEMARLASLSPPQFRRIFAKAMGVSPVQCLRRLRVERACALLRQTNDTVEAISAKVGYAQPAFFASTFKKMIGLPPGQYRVAREL